MKLNAMKEFALTLPGFGEIHAPENIPSGAQAPSDVVQTAMNLLIVVGVIAALIFLIYGGILWTTSGGDKTRLDKARRTIIFSVVGLIVMILAFVIVRTIGSLLGSSFLSTFGIQ